MQQVVDRYFRKFSTYCIIIFGLGLAGLALSSLSTLIPFIWAYLLSFAFVGSNFLMMRKINLDDHSRFVRIFGISLAVRFLLVIAAIILVLKTRNNHQIFFTVSFIISYICHSVIEIIFLNKILETDTGK